MYRIKAESIKFYYAYFGMNIKKWEDQFVDGEIVETYGSGAKTHVKEAIRIAKTQIHKHKLIFPLDKKTGKMSYKYHSYRQKLSEINLVC